VYPADEGRTYPVSVLKDDHKQVKTEQDAVRPQTSRIGTQRRDVSSNVCICGHRQEEHISSDRLDNSCQVDICECSNYATPIEEQRERSAQLGVGGTDRQDSSDTSTPVTQHEELRQAEKLEGDAAPVKSSMRETKTDTAGVNKNAQIQVVACVQVAMEKLDKVEADAKKKIDAVEAETKKAKSQIVQELARNLEGKIPTDEISSEITHQLHGRVSQRLIHDSLDEKYKKKHRVENARKQKKEQEHDLAALNEPVPLNLEMVVDNSGTETVEPAVQSRQPDHRTDTGINANTSKSEPSTITNSSADNRNYNSFDNSELSGDDEERENQRKCKNCEILQQKNEQLQSKLQGYEEVVRARTSIKTAKELIYRSTDGYQQFEFSVPFEPLRQQMIAAFNSDRSVNRVWFTGKFNQKTGEVVDIQIGKITDTNTTEIRQESKTSVVLEDDTLNDITGD
jgi:hypothetical protein